MAIALFGKYKKLLKLVGVNRSVFTQSLITKQTVSETTACGFGILQRQACTLHKRTNERLSCGIREGQRGFCTSFSPAQSSKSKAKAVENLFDTNVKSDVLLFSCYKSDRFYVVFCWASVVWFVIICLVAEVARFTLKQLKPESDEDKEKPWYKRFNLKNPIVRNAFVVMIFLVGVLGIVGGVTVPRRTIREIYLKAGGNTARIVTFGPFGRNKSMTLPLNDITPLHTRTEKSNLVMKINGHRGFFTCDTNKGVFHHEQLFDFSVGMKSKL